MAPIRVPSGARSLGLRIPERVGAEPVKLKGPEGESSFTPHAESEGPRDPYAYVNSLSAEEAQAMVATTPLGTVKDLLQDAHAQAESYAFAGDNFGPVDPKFALLHWGALAGPLRTYQRESSLVDETQQAFQRAFANHPGEPVAAYMTPSGTAGNRLGFDPIVHGHEAILLADNSHALTREAEAFGAFNHVGALPIETVDGKLTAENIAKRLDAIDPTYPNARKPMGISLTQPTEDGKLYTDAEVKAIAQVAHDRGLLLQMDGARLFYAAAATGKSLKALTTDLGVDMVFVGGSKGGMVAAEALVYTPNFFKHVRDTKYRGDDAPALLLQDLRTIAKQKGVSMGQAAGAMTQFNFALKHGHAVQLAEQSIKRARSVERVLTQTPGVSLYCPTETNAVMVTMPKALRDKLAQKYSFLTFTNRLPAERKDSVVVRFMTNSSTTPEQVAQLEQDLKTLGAEAASRPVRRMGLRRPGR